MKGGASVPGLQIPLFSEKKPASNDDFDSESKEWHESEVIMHHTLVLHCFAVAILFDEIQFILCHIMLCQIMLCQFMLC